MSGHQLGNPRNSVTCRARSRSLSKEPGTLWRDGDGPLAGSLRNQRHGTGWNPGWECPGIRYLLNSVVSFAGRTRNSVMRHEKDYSPEGPEIRFILKSIGLLAGRNRNPAPDEKKGTSWKIRKPVYHRKCKARVGSLFLGRYPPITTVCFLQCFNFFICGLTFSFGNIEYFSEDLFVPENETFSSGFTAFGDLLGAALHYHYGFGAVQRAADRDGGS